MPASKTIPFFPSLLSKPTLGFNYSVKGVFYILCLFCDWGVFLSPNNNPLISSLKKSNQLYARKPHALWTATTPPPIFFPPFNFYVRRSLNSFLSPLFFAFLFFFFVHLSSPLPFLFEQSFAPFSLHPSPFYSHPIWGKKSGYLTAFCIVEFILGWLH